MSLLSKPDSLHRLARHYGVQTAYHDVLKRRHQADAEALAAVLRSLGAPAGSLGDAADAARQLEMERSRRSLEPVIVAWEGESASFVLRLPAGAADTPRRYSLRLESGETLVGDGLWISSVPLREFDAGGRRYAEEQLTIGNRLPFGYHRLEIESGGRLEQSLVISAPLQAFAPDQRNGRSWGVFLPLYSLHTEKSWGGGDFSDLERLIDWTDDHGGSLVGTLPLLATFLDGEEPGRPYVPTSRLLWNEFFIDINKVPELEKSPAALALLSSDDFRRRIEARRQSSLVDYPAQAGLKRALLEEMCRALYAGKSERLRDFRRFLAERPMVDDYARFMAVGDQLGRSRRTWPERLRDGDIREGDYREEDRQYHAYAQWLAFGQMQAASDRARSRNLSLYLDLPVGIHPEGYDTWRQKEAFASGTAAGSPPDTVFTRGQNWGFPPLHPEAIRQQGYRHFIDVLRHHMRYAGVLRLDHVMGLHRIFCIPEGMDPKRGLYLRYHAEEMYAVLALESGRHNTIVVGEDLGTVPSYVRPAMNRHGLQRLYVMQYELAGPEPKLNPVPPGTLASLNTHDMPPFASYWQGTDIDRRLQLGLLDAGAASKEQDLLASVREGMSFILRKEGWLQEHRPSMESIITACYLLLASSRAWMVMLNLEDLWQETEPQNVPGTGAERANWRRRARLSFEQFSRRSAVLDILSDINTVRRAKRSR